MTTKNLYTGIFCLIFWAAFLENSQAQNINAADSLIAIYEKVHKSLEVGEKFDLLARIAQDHPNADVKIAYARQALEIAEKHDNDHWRAHCYNLIGYGYKWKGDLNRAVNAFFLSISNFEKVNNQHGMAAVYSALGDAYSAGSDHYNSVIYYRKAIDMLSRQNEWGDVATVMLNLGDEFLVKNELDSALRYNRIALNLNRRENNISGSGYCLGNIGLVLAKQNKLDSAKIYIVRSLDLLKKLGDRYAISLFGNSLASVCKAKGETDEAQQHAMRSLQIAKADGLKEQARDACLMLSGIFRDKKNYKRAYRYQNEYIAFRDSINNDEVIRKMADLRTEYEVSQKQAEVDLLEQRNKTQKIINFGLIIVVLLLIILAYEIFINSQKRKKINNVLSEQKQEIAAQRDRLQELVHMKDRFFGIISHDLRSPVNSLQGITQLLNHYVKVKQIDQIEEFVKLTNNSINNLSALLDNLLSWALSQQGSLPYNPEKFKYYFVAEEVKRIFANIALSKNIRFDVEVPNALEVWADRDSIFAMTRNLVNNAIKFTPEGGKICLKAAPQEAFVAIMVSDTGVGISKEGLKNIFAFDKKKSTKGTAGEKGSGLGLALCHDIVKLNKGDIKVESREQKGTAITVLIPAKKGASARH